jgi:hypothetical protein
MAGEILAITVIILVSPHIILLARYCHWRRLEDVKFKYQDLTLAFHTSISRQKSNNSFPAAWLVLLAAKFGLDLNYLAFGEEICRKPVTCDEDLETIAISYFNSRHPEISSKISSAERAIIIGEVKTLLDRFAQHLKSAE